MRRSSREAGAAAAAFAGRYRAHLALAGLAAGLLVAPEPVEAAILLAAAVAAALAWLRSPLLGVVVAALVLLGAYVGDARLRATGADVSGLQSTRSLVDARAHLLERPRLSRFGSAAIVRIASGPAAGARLHARAGRDFAWPSHARPGVELAVRGGVRPLSEVHGFGAHLRRRGVVAELRLTDVQFTGRSRGGVAGAIDRARARAERALGRGLGSREAALARGLVLGQDEAIDSLVRDDFRDAGLGHLLAVSGQNVVLLCALALPLLAFAGLGRHGRVVLLLLLIAAYVPLAGAGPPLQRAAVMGGAGLVAVAAGRPASRWYALLLAAAVTLMVNPRVSGDPGWQLSFAAVVGIVVLAPGLRGRLVSAAEIDGGGRRPLRGQLTAAIAGGVAITVAATVATAPLAALHFGAVPVAGLGANLAALPAVAPVMWIGMLQAALGQFEALPPVGGGAQLLERLLAAPAGLLLRYLAWVAESAATLADPLPLRPSPAGALAMYGVLAVGISLGRLLARHARHRVVTALAASRLLPPAARLAAGVGALAALVALAATALPPARPPNDLTVSFLDVGQGDATLVQHPDGTALLFDGGPPEARVARLLRRAGVSRLGVVVATHASRDHHGGLPEVLRRFRVGLLLEGGDGNPDPDFRALLSQATRGGTRVVAAQAGMNLRVGAITVRVLSPSPRPPGPAPADPNERGVIAIVSSGGFDLLLSADAESQALAPLTLPDVEAMKVPHHGSSDPGLPAVLRRLDPEVATIEVGEDNGYGHPAPSTLAALHDAVPHVYRTDHDGTVRLTVGADGVMRVHTEH